MTSPQLFIHDKSPLTDEFFVDYCRFYYINPQCHSEEEFLEDLKHIKYVKKLITRYIEKGDLKERLILNHIMILNNLFGATHLSRIMYLKLKPQFHCVKPFLVLLNVLPDKIYNVADETIIYTHTIPMDEQIIQALKELKNGN